MKFKTAGNERLLELMDLRKTQRKGKRNISHDQFDVCPCLMFADALELLQSKWI